MDALRRLVPTAAVLWTTAVAAPAQGQQDTTAVPDDTAEVVSLEELRVQVSRLRVGGLPLARTPTPAQALRREVVDRRADHTVADALDGLSGVSLSDQFGSAFQPDVRFRGFTVSPVVGLPQSVSVFVDGVRVNEADASQVHFHLIPVEEAERVEVIRGPLGPFGKNTLAGALNVVTRRGGGSPSLEAEAKLGRWDEMEANARVEGAVGAFDYYAAGRFLRSDGWRALNHAEQIQAFAKVGWRGEDTDAWISYTFADDSIEAPGSLPRSWLAGELPADVDPPDDVRTLQFTGGRGDFFAPVLHFVNARVDRRLGGAWSVQANAFGRFASFDQFNDNVTEPDALGITDIGSFGGTVQATHRRGESLVGTAGLELTRNDVDIEILRLPNEAFPEVERETTTRAGTVEGNVAVYSELWWALDRRLSVHGSLRFDHVSLPFDDRLEPDNSGENRFDELTGALGLDVDLPGGFSTFGSFGRGFRAPVILEITCADPENPCPLPFELGADPPLDPVTTHTWQAGLRYRDGDGARATLTGYWSEVYDDLFNVVDPETPTRGFFANLDRTRRQGLEVEATLVPMQDVRLDGSVAWTRATFQSEATLAAPFFEGAEEDEPGESADEGEGDDEPPVPRVEPGDRFPMVPEHRFTVGASWSPGPWHVGLEGDFVGSRFLVGDEGNLEMFGTLDPYFLLGGRLERTLGPATVWLRARNLLDTEHETFGIIAENVRAPGGGERIEPFVTPGRPFRLSGGVRYVLR